MISRIALAVACLFAAASVAAPAQTTAAPRKHLIEFGWDEPDTALLRKHIATMERTPFDGTVFHVTYDKPDGAKGMFLWECWSTRAFTEADFKQAREDVRATPLKSFTHNFLRFNVCPGDVDWFDDFASVVNNARLAAQLAKEARAAGVLFDTEQYNTQLFNYAKQKSKDSQSFEAYAKQCRQRGREVMTAFQDAYPDLVVFLTFGQSLPYAQTGGDRAKLAQVEYGLMAPFLDGMFDAARGKAKIVDGFESSYGYKSAQQFAAAAATVKQKLLPMVADREKYLAHVSIGFGLWLDYDWRKHGWDVTDVAKNYFTPQQFGESLKQALATADEYVWIYTEKPRWWAEPAGEPQLLPPAYVEAIVHARQGK
jgi:hypothetical protein